MGQHLRTGRPTRAEAAELERRLREAALEVFSDRGFEGATMEEIARAAGISKRTLYAKYPDKRALFAKVLPWAMSTLNWDAPDLDDVADDLPSALAAIARIAIARVVDPQVARLTRVAMSEAHHFPEFAEAAHSMTWSPRLRSVVDVLERHARAGAIVVDDPELAAEQFLAMVSGFPAMLAVFGLRRDPDDEERHIRHAVTLFHAGLTPR
ncbi:TetR/AcrR family transcriptional regulator [Actinomadura rugatobispora]|uniref:TetR/AcrR family transcriptional regulator n=1 Tax=Actinomadura rugatobispora TaxID=1994 RepID=A0ABW1A8E9_9ACTN|nr:TetR/AcrR family transcriptional regulator [Actinomadura rugatobispora]